MIFFVIIRSFILHVQYNMLNLANTFIMNWLLQWSINIIDITNYVYNESCPPLTFPCKHVYFFNLFHVWRLGENVGMTGTWTKHPSPIYTHWKILLFFLIISGNNSNKKANAHLYPVITPTLMWIYTFMQVLFKKYCWH